MNGTIGHPVGGGGGGGGVETSRTISTTAPLTGGGDLSANRTLALADLSDSKSGLTADAGSAQGNGALTPTTAGQREIFARYTTVTTAGDCCTLPDNTGSNALVRVVIVANRGGGNAMDVFPASGGTLWVDGAALAQDAATSIEDGAHLTFYRFSGNDWEAL